MLNLQPNYKSRGLLALGGLLLVWLVFANSYSVAAAQSEPVDLSFKSGTGLDASVNAVVIQPDGKILVGGRFQAFNNVSRRGILRLNADSSLDTSFNPGLGVNIDTGVNAILLQPDGKILIGGNFASYNGSGHKGITRLNSDGSLDSTFNPGGTGLNSAPGFTTIADTLVMQPDGKILVGGSFAKYNDVAQAGLLRLNSDGTLDTSFNNGGSGTPGRIRTIALQSDTKILLVGKFNSYNGVALYSLARLNSDGSVDNSFAGGFTESTAWDISQVAIQPDGKVLIGGYFSTYAGVNRPNLARLNGNGSLDNSFNPTTVNGLKLGSMFLQADGKILVGGRRFAGPPDTNFQRLNSDGSVDSGFISNVKVESYVDDYTIYALAVHPNGKILLGGLFVSYNGVARNRLAQLNSNGELDLNFYSDTNIGAISNIYGRPIYSMAVQPDGKTLIGGNFAYYNGTTIRYLARLNTDGTLDSSFNTNSNLNGEVSTVLLQPDGKILIAGEFLNYNGVSRRKLARLNADSSLDTTFKPTIESGLEVEDIVYQPDGKVVIIGNNAQYSGFVRRFNTDGTLDANFNPGTFMGPTYRMKLQGDGKILVGGGFTNYAGVARKGLVRLNTDGSLDASFDIGSGFSLAPTSLAIDKDSKILVGGDFSTFNGQATGPLVRLNPDGSRDTSFATSSMPIGVNSYPIYAIYLQNDDQILIGGLFQSYNSQPHAGLAQLSANGVLNLDFNVNFNKAGTVLAIAGQADGKVLVGGDFSRINNSSRGSLARLVVGAVAPSVTLTGTPQSSEFSQPVTFTAQITPMTATGTVSFILDGNISVTRSLVNGVATYTTNTLAIGTHTVQAAYNGDANLPAVLSEIYNHKVTMPCAPLVVTSPVDDGAATICGTFSYAVLAASSGTTITFALPQGNVITFNGSLTPALPAGVTVDGGVNDIVLNGNAQTGDGLRLSGNNRLLNLTIRRFAGRELVANFGGNWFYKVYAEN